MSLHGADAAKILLDEFQKAYNVEKRIHTFTREGKIFKQPHYYAQPIRYSYTELAEITRWCWDTFGTPGYNIDQLHTTWDYTTEPEHLFWFSDEKHLMLFILRWS